MERSILRAGGKRCDPAFSGNSTNEKPPYTYTYSEKLGVDGRRVIIPVVVLDHRGPPASELTDRVGDFVGDFTGFPNSPIG